MTTKAKVTFAIPETLKNELKGRVVKDGYGLRGKSLWVSEAVVSLIEMKDFLDLFTYSDELQGLDEFETIVLDGLVKAKLEKAIVQVRTEFPITEGVQSRILRTAILQRILRT